MALSQFVGKVIGFEPGDLILFGIFSPRVGKRRLGLDLPLLLLSTFCTSLDLSSEELLS